MYKLIKDNETIGLFENLIFTKKSKAGCFIQCTRGEADGCVANGTVYAITNSEDYADYDQVIVSEVDGGIEHAAELDYIRIMSDLA